MRTQRKFDLFAVLSSTKLTVVLGCILLLLSANLRFISKNALPHNKDSYLRRDLQHFHEGSARLRMTKESISHNFSYSACLLTMDDNSRLPEWLSYHYFALNLRYLVVAVDPNSRTSPSAILDRFRSRMKVVEWTDRDFTSRHLHRRGNASEEWITAQHRTRQWLF